MIKAYPRQLLIIIALHFMVFSTLGMFRHWGYMSSINDLGCYDQAVWGIIHKGFPLNSFVFPQTTHWLGQHFNLILYLFVPLYYLVPTVNWFIFAQSGALAVTAMPIFLLAKQVTHSEKQALLWSVIYLCNPFVLSAEAWDFHPVSFATPFMAVAFLAIEQRKPRLFVLANLILLLCQEQFGLTVASFGLLYGLKNHEKYLSSVFVLLGTVSVVVILTVVMPSLSPTKQHMMFGHLSGTLAALNRYGWLGHSLPDVFKTLLFSPGYVLKTIAFKFAGLEYLKNLFLPFLFVSLAAPIFILPIATDLLANLLSAVPMPRSLFSYHSVTLIPVLTIAAIYGSQKIVQFSSFLTPLRLSQYSCGVTIILSYSFAPLPLPFAQNIWQPTQVIVQHDSREEEIKALIADKAVSAQANIGVHFSQREHIYLFPKKLNDSNYVILWLNSPTRKYAYFSPAYDVTTLGHHLQMRPNEYLSEIKKLLADKNFKIAYWNKPWLVFKRETHSSQNNLEAEVLDHINAFQKKLQSQNLS